MTDDRPRADPRDALERTLIELGTENAGMTVVDAGPEGTAGADRFADRFPERYVRRPAGDPAALAASAERASSGAPVVAIAPALAALGLGYAVVRDRICRNGLRVTIASTDAGLRLDGSGGPAPMLEDLGLARAVPGLTVVAPADAPSTGAAVRAVTGRDGPAYVRLPVGPVPTVTDGSFEVGRAPTLRDGTDLTVVAVGSMVGRALDLAAELAAVGVSARVLDLASVKPFDAPAILRAARDTGAILTAEEHSVVSGIGALVASVTAENYPVPVRRVGVPDVFADVEGPGPALDRHGLSAGRLRDEAWELLRLRGKVE
jgi:transketolase